MALNHGIRTALGNANTYLLSLRACAVARMAFVVLVMAWLVFLNILSNGPKLVQLLGFRHTCVDTEVGVANNNLVLPGLLLPFDFYFHFFYHIVSRNENSIEKCRVAKSFMGRVYFTLEVNFTIILGSVNLSL